MPLHSAATAFQDVEYTTLLTGVAALISAYAVKIYSSGAKCTWEREWAGKMIIIAAPPEPTTLALIHHLLHLPSPPQILYLPPLPSPLPEPLLTVLHTIRLSASTNPLAQLHCEALPPTARAVRDFARLWASAPYGTAGEGGRRLDAIVLGGAWECKDLSPRRRRISEIGGNKPKFTEERWTPQQFHFHFITSLLPSLLRQPAERNIRIITLVSPGWSAAIPGLQAGLEGKPAKVEEGELHAAGRRGVQSLLLQTHLRLILDTLASATYSKKGVVPDPNDPIKKRDDNVQSNILALSVVMPWARDEVIRPVWGQGSTIKWFLYLILFPIVLLFTPSPAKSIQSILYALSAPVKYATEDEAAAAGNAKAARNADEIAGQIHNATPGKSNEGTFEIKEDGKDTKMDVDADILADPRRNGVRQGSTVRNCGLFDLPPVLHDALLARATYEKLEAEVEAGVRTSESREKEFNAEQEKAKAAADAEKEKEKLAAAAAASFTVGGGKGKTATVEDDGGAAA